jgi:hypothetical protein
MTRSALSLLLLLTSWLLALPELRAATAPHPVAVVAVSHDQARAGEVRDHVAAQSAMPQVPRAPLLARLPALPMADDAWYPHRQSPCACRPHDLRAELRRVQTRRRLPRLGGGEPPWS